MSIKRYLKKPAFYSILAMSRVLPDRLWADAFYLKVLYRYKMRKRLNLKEPGKYTEKLQWLKLYDRNPAYTQMVDKHAVKDYVTSVLGEGYVIPTLGVWEHFDDIDFGSLPDQFVLKCTHDSGGLVICRDKSNMNMPKARETIMHALKRRYYLNTREWPYKDVKPRIIAEQYMVDESGCELKDYKFFVFNGVMQAMFIVRGRNSDGETYSDFFDREFRHLPLTSGHPNSPHPIEKPEGFEEMIRLAEKLGKGIPQARIDFYNINGKIYFGEITFFHWSGLMHFQPEEWDVRFGEWLELPRKS